jgi:hypothetical protein
VDQAKLKAMAAELVPHYENFGGKVHGGPEQRHKISKTYPGPVT